MDILEVELALRPKDAQVHYQIAWTHDQLGKERDAVPAYEKAIELGLPIQDLKSAFLGLASTYRTLGEYQKSKEVFERAMPQFPEFRALKAFYCLTLYNLGRHDQAFELLLKELVETTNDPSIKEYERALLFYSDKLGQVFD